MADAAPNETLYVNNLNDKIKQDRLRESLYSLFSTHGSVLTIISSGSRKGRGQAWIVFNDIPSATEAKRALHETELFDKPMRIRFAKSKSDVIAKRDGTWVPREKRKKEDQGEKENVKQAKTDDQPQQAALPTRPANPPNKILFLERLPEAADKEMLETLFQQYNGFKEVRMVPGKKGLAFVEFADEVQSGIALQALSGFKLTPTDLLDVQFAK